MIVRCGFQGIDKAKVKLRKAADGTKLYVAGLKFKETFEIIGGNTAVPGKLKDTVRVTLNKKSKITPVSIIPHAEITDHMISYFYYKNCTMSGFGLHKDSVGVLYSSPLDIPMALLEEHDRFTFEAATFPRSLVDDNLGKALVLLEKGYTFDAETDPLYILSHKIADKLPTSTVMYGDSGSGLIYQERSGQGRWVLMGVASKTRIRLTTTDSVPTFTIHNIYEHPGDAPTPVTP